MTTMQSRLDQSLFKTASSSTLASASAGDTSIPELHSIKSNPMYDAAAGAALEEDGGGDDHGRRSSGATFGGPSSNMLLLNQGPSDDGGYLDTDATPSVADATGEYLDTDATIASELLLPGAIGLSDSEEGVSSKPKDAYMDIGADDERAGEGGEKSNNGSASEDEEFGFGADLAPPPHSESCDNAEEQYDAVAFAETK